MSTLTSLRLPKWPFLAGDALLLATAAIILWLGGRPLPDLLLALMAGCVALAAFLGVLPFLREYRALSDITAAARLDSAMTQLRNIEAVARQIASATAGWQAIQDDAGKAVQAADQISTSIAKEARSFQEFLAKANDTERTHLRLEVEKLRRAQGDWLSVLVRILDHIYALYTAAERSGQAALTQQLGAFQTACRDAARRVGLVPFEARPGDPFSADVHQPAQQDTEPATDAVVADTIASGYRFQGGLLRRALVTFTGDHFDDASDSIDTPRQEESAAEPRPVTLEDPNASGEQSGSAAPDDESVDHDAAAIASPSSTASENADDGYVVINSGRPEDGSTEEPRRTHRFDHADGQEPSSANRSDDPGGEDSALPEQSSLGF